jgi:hypothetical protein
MLFSSISDVKGDGGSVATVFGETAAFDFPPNNPRDNTSPPPPLFMSFKNLGMTKHDLVRSPLIRSQCSLYDSPGSLSYGSYSSSGNGFFLLLLLLLLLLLFLVEALF